MYFLISQILKIEPTEVNNEMIEDKATDKEDRRNENRSFHFTSSIEKVKDVSTIMKNIFNIIYKHNNLTSLINFCGKKLAATIFVK